MLKFLFMMLFMIPLCFNKKSFWLNQCMYFMMSFMFMMMGSFNYLWMNISYFFGSDLLSFGLILLSFWICSLMIMASESINKNNFFMNFFLFLLLMLLMFLYCTFSSMNLFLFYFFFECSLIPTLILIMGWGYQPERLQAGIYLLFYTLFASLPMMIGIFYYYNYYMSLDFFFFNNLYYFNMYMYICMIFAFLVKMPMYMVHLWLPKAHVEAPVSGSMILAGIMLKLGGYGLLRILSMFVVIGMSMSFLFISISLIGGMLVSLICLRQTDLKLLIAYSSVSHMGLVLGGIMTFNSWGYCGSYMMMIAHGLCSSGLFCLANISYERMNSRSMFMNKGLLNLMPSMTLWWFLLSSCNMAAPPSMNLMGEISLLNSMISWSWISIFILMFLSFFSAVYTLYLYSFSQHGKIYSGKFSCYSGYIREYLLLFLHWFPLNLLILKSNFFMMWI
uniref:NADH dehydrogenase subunit 4 n=1 Tax=Nipponoharpalus discrepans TaxID=3070804 RepID=UPI002182553A|nr:NADH dehydrogenase subunit 4 [Nipponoharpalus discrepans]UVG42129.1 NADH dehydrogenase subunit 4 [Nipponoharpalus discrepans]